MKLSELFNYRETADLSNLLEYIDTEFTPPNPLPAINKKSELLGEISCKIGNLSVYKNNDPGYKTYIVTDGDGKTLAFLDICLLPISGYAMAKNAYCVLPNKGIMTGLFNFVVQHEHIKLLSDYKMTSDGVGLWDSIIKKHVLSVHVIDIDTGKKYSLSDAAKQNIKTDDNDTVILPKIDTRPEPTHTLSANTQRFMFIAESRHNPSVEILKDEDILPEWNGVKEKMVESAKLIPCYSYQYWEGP